VSARFFPEGWRSATLGSCCEIVSGGTPRRDVPQFWNGAIPWVTPKDISDLNTPDFCEPPEAISDAGLKNSSAVVLPKGSVLFSSRAPIGLVAIAGQAMATNQGFKSLVPGPDIDNRFLYWTMKRMAPHIAARGNGATFPEVSKAVMSEMEIQFPKSRDEQRRIAAILDKADAIRLRRRQALAEIDNLLRATFLDMFGDPGRDAAVPTKPLVEFVDPSRPITYGILKPGTDQTDGVPYIRVVDMQEGRVLTDQVRRTTAAIAHEYRRSTLKAGDLLMSIRGHVGRYAFVPCELEGANITQDTARLSIPDENDALFLRACLESPGMQRLMVKLTKGGAVKGINLSDVRDLPVPVTCAMKREHFARIARQCEGNKSRARAAVVEAEELFGSLSQRAFKGDL